MGAINWQQFGLKTDPYDIQPLSEGSELPLEQAFIGREREREFLEELFTSHNRLCLTIGGEVGVGKTSLANFAKYLWKYRRVKLLFSFRREIEASTELLTKRAFLLEVMASVIREIRLLQPELLQQKALAPIRSLTDIVPHASLGGGLKLEVAGFGGGVDLQKAAGADLPVTVPMALLEEHFLALVKFLKETPINGFRYAGLIVHVNNFDILLAQPEQKRAVSGFFNEIRDILQTPDVYFLFLGPQNLFQDIIAREPRVKSAFYQTPLQVKPLTKPEIIAALDGRLKLLKSGDVREYIKPVEDEVVYALYDLYAGDIRSIMAALRDILGQSSERLAGTVGRAEAQALLVRERWDRLEHAVGLTPEQLKIVRHFAQSPTPLSQKDIAEAFGIAQPNVSGYYFKPLKEAGVIEEQEGTAKPTYWQLTWEYRPLKWTETIAASGPGEERTLGHPSP